MEAVSLRLGGAIIVILPLAALLWWFLATFALGRTSQPVRPTSIIGALPWKKNEAPVGANQAPPE